jgi:dTDP-4-amino-4,6-dideoxygalactose transaminase
MIGDCGAFSFHPRKSITTGEGGMVTTEDKQIADRVRMLRSHGESLSDEFRHKSDEVVYPDFELLGFNYRMTDIQAAIGVEQMKKLPYMLEERRRIADRYNDLLSDLEKEEYLLLPPKRDGFVHSYQSYVILLMDKVRIARDRLSNELQKRGIATRKGTYHVPGIKCYREDSRNDKGDLNNSKKANDRSLAIPMYAGMNGEDVVYVVEHLTEAIKQT